VPAFMPHSADALGTSSPVREMLIDLTAGAGENEKGEPGQWSFSV
jgi:hypothetical protein